MAEGTDEGHLDFLAVIDQLVEEHGEVARLVAKYYHNLIARDVPSNHAVMLAGTYQRQVLAFLEKDEPST